jgi:uncharacterized protein YsxB (DUF464 family)
MEYVWSAHGAHMEYGGDVYYKCSPRVYHVDAAFSALIFICIYRIYGVLRTEYQLDFRTIPQTAMCLDEILRDSFWTLGLLLLLECCPHLVPAWP